jgi:cytochrome P450 monooxygenase
VSNALFQLARHPYIWTKLRQISLELGDARLTFEKLKSLVEFRYVLLETIRICGPAACVWRIAVRDTILPVGGGLDQKSPVFVARGTPVVLGTWSMNHAKDIWGDDIHEFKPDRWIGRKPLWEFRPIPRWSPDLPGPATGLDSCYLHSGEANPKV